MKSMILCIDVVPDTVVRLTAIMRHHFRKNAKDLAESKAKNNIQMNDQSQFRLKEHQAIYRAITGCNGNVIQVFGPPMVGKSCLIQQVVQEIAAADEAHGRETKCHDIWCKNIYTLQDIFNQIIQALYPNKAQTSNDDLGNSFDMQYILQQIKKLVCKSKRCRHIFIFHKCESFPANGSSHSFLSFLGEIVTTLQCTDLNFHLVFSTYKRFSLSGYRTSQVNVGMLIDPWDILHLLKQYSPGVDVIPYVYICQRYLCLPGAIVQLAVRYISQNVFWPETLELLITKDMKFYSKLFDTRVIEAFSWLTKYELELIALINSVGWNPYDRDLIEHLINQVEKGADSYFNLLTNLVIEEIDQSNLLFVHPFALYKCSLDCPVNEQESLCKTNSYTQFLGHVLIKAQTNIQKHGIKGQTYGCPRMEWPYIKCLFHKALVGGFKDILRVAVVARRLIMVLYPNEAKQFYSGLYRTTHLYGSPRESAVMEACLGHITASGAGIDFPLALEYLNSALDTLKVYGPTFFYKWTLRRKAIILYRISRYPESTKYFEKAKAVQGFLPMSPDDYEILSVSFLQAEEDDVIGEIYETIPMIFTGDNETALKQLLALSSNIHDRIDYHPDLDVLLNNIGLALQRGYKDLKEALKWYTKSLQHRSMLVKINPQLMVVTLNNVAMIKLSLGDLVGAEGDLQKALTILREGCWYHYNTALTLASLSDIKIKLGKFEEAYNLALKAEEILKTIYKNNDYRLKINLGIFHCRFLLGHFANQYRGVDLMDRDLQTMVDLGASINKHMSDDSHNILLSIYEHGMVINWRVYPERFRAYKEMFMKHVEENSLVKEMLHKTEVLPGQQALLTGHQRFFDYLKVTEDVELQKLLDMLALSCPICKCFNGVLGKKMWLKDFLSPLQLQRPVTVSNEKPVALLLAPKGNFDNGSKCRHCLVKQHNSEFVFNYHWAQTFPARNLTPGRLCCLQCSRDLNQILLSSCLVNPSQNTDSQYHSINLPASSCVLSNRSFCIVLNPSDINDKSSFQNYANISNIQNLVLHVINPSVSLHIINPSVSLHAMNPSVSLHTMNSFDSLDGTRISQIVTNVSVSFDNKVYPDPMMNHESIAREETKNVLTLLIANPSISSAHSSLLNMHLLNPSVYLEQTPCQSLSSADPLYSFLEQNTASFISLGRSLLNPSTSNIDYSNLPNSFSVVVGEILDEAEIRWSIRNPNLTTNTNSSNCPFSVVNNTSLEGCNSFSFYTLSSTFSYHDYLSLSSAPIHGAGIAEYLWTGCYVSQEHRSVPSNPVYCLGSGQYGTDRDVNSGFTDLRESSVERVPLVLTGQLLSEHSEQ
nr:kinesin light chain 4-like isoform X2 [Biomphalaria glabrata]